jgi:hypothetical protein
MHRLSFHPTIVGRDRVARNCQLTISFEPQPSRPARARPHCNSSWPPGPKRCWDCCIASGSPIRCCAASARYPASKPCAENASGSNPATAQRRFDQIDRLRRERLFLHRFPARSPGRSALLDVDPLQPFAQRLARGADQKHPALLVDVAHLGPPELNCEAWSRGRFRIARMRRAGAHPSAARRAAAPLRCAGARWTRTPREGSRDPGYRPDDPSHRSRSADPRHPGRGRGGQSQRRPPARRGEWSLDPFTTVQRAPARGAPLEGFRGTGAISTQQPPPAGFGQHPWASHVGGRSRASKDPRDHAPRISTRAPRSSAMAAASRSRRPPKPPNRRGPTRAPAGYSRPCLREREASGFDAIVSQKLSEPIAPVHRQDGHERIEILGAAGLRVEMGQGPFP